TIVLALQAADEVRRIQRIAYRVALLRRVRPGFGEDGRAAWLGQAAWQPLRETIERLLVTHDFGEALIALNLCLKPALDDIIMLRFAEVAAADGDYVLAQMTHSLAEDCAWQRQWTFALGRLLCADQPDNPAIMRAW